MQGNTFFGFSGGGGGTPPPPTNNSWLLDGNTNGSQKYFGTNDNYGIPIYTNGLARGIFSNNGDFGIGTITPSARLEVVGVDSTSLNYSLKIDNSASSPLLYVRNDARVGIGIASPAYDLDVTKNVGGGQFVVINSKNSSSTGASAVLASNDIGFISMQVFGSSWSAPDTLNTGILATSPTIAQMGIVTTGVSDIYFATNSSGSTNKRMIILSSGNIGMNKLVPSAILHVQGIDATSSNYALKVDNSASISLLYIRNDGYVTINGLNVGKSVNQVLSNTAFGVDALSVATGIENTAIGYQALQNNTTGATNTAVGNNALLLNTIGIQNTAIGYNSNRSNVIGNNNTSVGFYTLFNNIGDNNTAIGDRASYSNTSGSQNVAIGRFSLYTNLIGQHNVSIGHNTLNLNTSSGSVAIGSGASAQAVGSNLVSVGRDSFAELTTGIQNTVLGWNSGRGIVTGSYNTILGSNIIGLSSSLNNSIVIGNSSGLVSFYTNSSGNTMIGNGVIDATARLQVVGIDATSLNYALKVDNSASSPLLYVRNDGNVSINQDSYYNAKLDFGSYFVATSNPNSTEQTSHIKLFDNGSVFYGFGVSNDALNIAANQSSGNIKFFTNSVCKVWINSSGNLNVNNIANPSQNVANLAITSSDSTSSKYGFYVENSSFVAAFNVRGDANTGIGGLASSARVRIFGIDASTSINQRLEPALDVTEDTTGDTLITSGVSVNTLVQSITIPNDKVVSLETTIVYRKLSGVGVGSIGDGTTIKLNTSAKNISTVVTLDTIQNTYTGTVNSIIGASATYNVIGQTVRVVVNGVADNDIRWNVITKVNTVA
jgi:hypothetical protein